VYRSPLSPRWCAFQFAIPLTYPRSHRVRSSATCALGERPALGLHRARQVNSVLQSLCTIASMQVLQRPDWHGSPRDLGELFIVRKKSREATCKLRTHQLGWEVLLFVGRQLEVVQSQVCRTQDEVLTIGEQWKAAMIEKGCQ
jgi:hypothetical protein